MAKKTLKIQLIKGLAGKRKEHVTTVRSLGLRRFQQVIEKPDTPEIRGQINKVSYLLDVQEVA